MGKKKKEKQKKVRVEEYHALSPQAKKAILIIFLFALSAISMLSFLEMAGAIGVIINDGLAMVFGLSKIIFPLVILLIIYALLKPNQVMPRIITSIGFLMLFMSINGLLHSKLPLEKSLDLAFDGAGGGLIGYAVNAPLQQLLGFWGSMILMIAAIAVSFFLIFNSGLGRLGELFSFANPFARQSDDEEEEDDEYEEYEDENDDEEEEGQTVGEEVKLKRKGLFARKAKLAAIAKEKKPATEKAAESKFKSIKIDLPINLLKTVTGKPKSGDVNLAMERIETTLSNFGIEVEMDEVSVGPTVTQYTLKPADGVKVSKITSLGNDLALALAAHPIRIEAPIPGKSLVGIEVPNHQPAMVGIKQIIESSQFKTQSVKSNLTLGLGKDVSGKCWATDLARMPHLLVAGATGSGKSVCLNTIIISLLYQNNPDMLRMILVDPKRVEFPVYNGVPHLLTPVITDVTKTVNALRWTIQEMDRRFDVLAKEGKRNISSYNEVAEDKMPYLVLVIDELADLMVAASSEVETSIIRLTQMARAVGIHLIVATQRPSVDVITGLIKANIPGRIAFSVASSMDSRTILDSVGAEKLIGKGDMLFQTAELSKPKRLQGAYIDDNEIRKVVNFLKQAAGEPEYDESVTEKQTGKTSFDFGGKKGGSSDDDELLGDAKQAVIEAGKASASYLQRRLRVGYARAARLIDLLEEQGIVSPADGARPRQILTTSLDNDREEPETPTVFKSESEDENEPEPEDSQDDQDMDDDEAETPELAVS